MQLTTPQKKCQDSSELEEMSSYIPVNPASPHGPVAPSVTPSLGLFLGAGAGTAQKGGGGGGMRILGWENCRS